MLVGVIVRKNALKGLLRVMQIVTARYRNDDTQKITLSLRPSCGHCSFLASLANPYVRPTVTCTRFSDVPKNHARCLDSFPGEEYLSAQYPYYAPTLCLKQIPRRLPSHSIASTASCMFKDRGLFVSHIRKTWHCVCSQRRPISRSGSLNYIPFHHNADRIRHTHLEKATF